MTATPTATTTTRTIAGHPLTLARGRRYLASRPMACRGMTRFDISSGDEGNQATVICPGCRANHRSDCFCLRDD